jgi:cytochrome c biogenesis protein CcmG, thiol:disulfide interchange protein DsbE
LIGAVGPGGRTEPQEPSPAPPPPAAPFRSRRPRTLPALVIGSCIAVLLAGLLVFGLGAKSGRGASGPLVAIGGEAPGFSLPPLTGAMPVDLDALGRDAHRPVVLNFFASWCTPCQVETPLLARTASVGREQGSPVQFVGVDVNDPPADARQFVEKAGIGYPVGMDQTFRVTSGLYGLYGLPQTFFIGADGRVLGHTIGKVNAADVQSWMKKLAEPAH